MTRYSDIKISEICDAIDAALGEVLVASGDLVRSDNYDELTEGMNDQKVLQIYPDSENPVDSFGGQGQTHKMTLGSDPVIIEEITIVCDFYARQRSHIGEDMKALVTGIDAIRANLKTQQCPIFNVAALREFQWRWERTIFEYGAPELKYIGVRFYLTFRIY